MKHFFTRVIGRLIGLKSTQLQWLFVNVNTQKKKTLKPKSKLNPILVMAFLPHQIQWFFYNDLITEASFVKTAYSCNWNEHRRDYTLSILLLQVRCRNIFGDCLNRNKEKLFFLLLVNDHDKTCL